MIDELTASPIHVRALSDLQLRLSKAHAYIASLLALIAKMKEGEQSLRAEISAIEGELSEDELFKDSKDVRIRELEEELAKQKLAWEQVYTDRDLWRSQMLQVALSAGIDLSNVDANASTLREKIIMKIDTDARALCTRFGGKVVDFAYSETMMTATMRAMLLNIMSFENNLDQTGNLLVDIDYDSAAEVFAYVWGKDSLKYKEMQEWYNDGEK